MGKKSTLRALFFIFEEMGVYKWEHMFDNDYMHHVLK